jgi:hypothetical protein
MRFAYKWDWILYRSLRANLLKGHAIALIVAKSEADAEDYEVRDLGFVKVDNTRLASGCIHIVAQALKQN